MLETNKIYTGDCVTILKDFPDDSIDMVLTSPPYDNHRTYHGYILDFNALAQELYRILKPNSSVIWVVADETTKGSESGSAFKQALYFKEIGFNLHDTMIYLKNSASFPANKNSTRYSNIFEYMFILSKGKPKCNLLCDKPNIWAGYTNWGISTHYNKNGETVKRKKIKPIPLMSPRNNVWKYNTGVERVKGHPAIFPLQLAKDHILSWSNKDDIILDPLCGSGTTCVAAKMLNRKYIGIDISEIYCNLAQTRLNSVTPSIWSNQ